eukprot:1189131-Prorocentrum_minimum.AAC.2
MLLVFFTFSRVLRLAGASEGTGCGAGAKAVAGAGGGHRDVQTETGGGGLLPRAPHCRGGEYTPLTFCTTCVTI